MKHSTKNLAITALQWEIRQLDFGIKNQKVYTAILHRSADVTDNIGRISFTLLNDARDNLRKMKTRRVKLVSAIKELKKTSVE